MDYIVNHELTDILRGKVIQRIWNKKSSIVIFFMDESKFEIESSTKIKVKVNTFLPGKNIKQYHDI